MAVLAAVLLVVPMYLGRTRTLRRRPSLARVLAYALVTSHIFADALSESTFLFFWTSGLWMALRFLRQGEVRWLLSAIVLALLAYLASSRRTSVAHRAQSRRWGRSPSAVRSG